MHDNNNNVYVDDNNIVAIGTNSLNNTSLFSISRSCLMIFFCCCLRCGLTFEKRIKNYEKVV